MDMDLNSCTLGWFDFLTRLKPLPPQQEPQSQSKPTQEKEEEEEMDIEITCEETEMEKCFRISITRHKILSLLSIDDLKKMGQVSKDWRQLSSAELVRRDCFRIEMEFDSAFKEDFLVLRKGLRSKMCEWSVFSIDLTLFNKLIITDSIAFPCSDFSVSGGDLNSTSSSIQDFFAMHGKNVLTLLLHQVKYSKDILYKVLSEKIPNLKKLSISWPKAATTTTEKSSSSMEFPHQNNNNNNLYLPSLKFLHFDESMNKTEESRNLALDLMNSAPNLKIIGNFPLSLIDENNPPPSKIKIMREIHVHAENEMELKSLTRFIEAKAQLLILNVSSPRKHVLDAKSVGELALILENSKKTLEILRWTHSGLLPEHIVFPRVTELALKIGKNPVESFIGEIILDRFPKLTSLCLKFPVIFCECDPIFENYFIVQPAFFNPFHNNNNNNNNENENGQITFTRITNMEISGEFPSRWWSKLRDVFPAVKSFNTRDCPSGRNLMGVAFKLWTELQTLEFAHNSVVYNDGKYYREKNPGRIQAQPEPDLFSILHS